MFLEYLYLKMIKRLFGICLVFLGFNSFCQDRNINVFLDYTLKYRGLTRQDITIPIEFFTSAEKSPTNDAKLMLPLVKDIMINPLRSMTWLDSISALNEKDLTETIKEMFRINGLDYTKKENKINFISRINDLLEMMEEQLGKSQSLQNTLLKIYSNDELTFLRKNLFSIIEDTDSEDDSNVDIFKFNKTRDSSIATSKKTMDLLAKIDMEKVISGSFDDYNFCYQLYSYVSENRDLLNKFYDDFRNPNKFGVTVNVLGRNIIIRGKENNVYRGNHAFIVDLGGDDVYDIGNDRYDFGEFRCIIDLEGNDHYTTSSSFALAGGLFSSSFIFDKQGDDVYESRGSGNLGSAIGGIGLVYDEKGSDTYRSISFSIGAGCFGVGLIADREGNDVYIANSYSQGFGMTQGTGAIIDTKGNDSYLVDARSLDIGRYNDHYVSMCQGYGLGLRPYYAGGVGLIVEGGGNDIYYTDIFGQGGAYWYSLGAIVDRSGHDKYNSYKNAKGAGIHLAVALLN